MMSDTYLMHHGIKGMHWGVRRYQNEDGSLTEAGKKRYYRNIAKQDLKDRAMNVLSHPNSQKASAQYAIGKDAYSIAKDRDKASNQDDSKKSAKRLEYEKEYQEKGYSKEDAELAALYKDRTKKLLAIAGGAALATAAYAGYKYYDNNADHFISDKMKLYRMSSGNKDSLHNGAYVTSSKIDAIKYKGVLPIEKAITSAGRVSPKDWHQKIMSTASGGLTVAGDKAGKKALSTALSNASDYTKEDLRASLARAEIDSAVAGAFRTAHMHSKAIKDLDAGKYDSSALYKATNIAIPYGDRFNKDGFRSVYFNELKKNGYGALTDVNDRSYSGYKARRSAIIFDADSVKMEESKTIGKKALGSAAFAGVMMMSAAPLAAVKGVNTASDTYRHKKQTEQIAAYKKEHPNTKMSDAEILDKVYKVDKYN